jgi:hypothetical protein
MSMRMCMMVAQEVGKAQVHDGQCHTLCALQLAVLGRVRRKYARDWMCVYQAGGSGEDAASV